MHIQITTVTIILMRQPYILILGLILLTSLFFRTYEIIGRFEYGHDAELFSWIVKDIAVNLHPRLIGQLTSAPGIFVGPFFYYLLVPFFLLFKMDPAGALVPVTVIGVLTTLSYYLVFSKLFNKTAGLVAAFLHAILLGWVVFDRQIVPSTLSNIWVVWYFYTIIQIGRGKFFVLPLLGILAGLIWHIHIALLPALLAVPFAFLVSKKIPGLKELLLPAAAFFIISLPLVIFEIRHNFIQTHSFIENLTADHGGKVGQSKLIYIFEMASKNISNLFLSPYPLPDKLKPLFTLGIASLTIFLIKKKVLEKNQAGLLFAVIIGVIGFFTLSSSLISEYYLYSIEIIFVCLIALTLAQLMKNRSGKYIAFLILGGLLIKNLYAFTTVDVYKKGYQERKGVVEFITTNAEMRGLPCFAISYITTPGENTGFRYFFYLKKQRLVRPSREVPVYNIVIPDELSKEEVKQKFGHIGVITPARIPPKEILQKSCQTPDTNSTDPLFGYVD